MSILSQNLKQECQFKQLIVADFARLNHFLKQHKQSKAGRTEQAFILESQQRIVASARLIPLEASNQLRLRGVFVIEALRRQGLGKKLLEDMANKLDPKTKIYTFPLSHLDRFYSDLGFQNCDLADFQKS